MSARSPQGLIVILLQWRANPLELELADAMKAVLEDREYDAAIRREGDPAAFDADTLLLLSDCIRYESLPPPADADSPRPRVILWQMHPMPPPDLDRSAERLGLWTENISRRALGALGRLSHLIEMPLYTLAARTAARDPAWTGPRMDWHTTRAVMRRLAWLKSAVAAGRIDRIHTTTPQAAAYLRSRGISASFIPLGIHPMLAHDPGLERDLDVVFLGSLNRAARAKNLERLNNALRAGGIKLTVVGRDCYGEDRTRLLGRTRVLININKYSWDSPWLRFLLATGCGAAIVCEPIDTSADSPWRAGEHFVEAPLDGLATEAIRLARDESARRALVERARRMLAEHLSMEASVESLLGARRESTLLKEAVS